jgi:hypothetical protein
MSAIEGVGPNVGIATNEQGGMQSETPYRFDLKPPESEFAAARVYAEGAKRYAPDNWRKISVRDHLNHLLQHVYAYLAGDTQDDHLAHAICRAEMAYAVSQQKGETPLPVGQMKVTVQFDASKFSEALGPRFEEALRAAVKVGPEQMP